LEIKDLPIGLEIKDTTDTSRSASYLHTFNRDYFNFPTVNFPFIGSNIPVDISELVFLP
jgi:hypothetical protein